VRQWIKCARAGCSNTFERVKSSYRYCSDKCADYCTTNERRAKIKLLKQANTDWKKLPRDERKYQDHWQWIAEWVGRQSGDAYKVKPAWAKNNSRRKYKMQSTAACHNRKGSARSIYSGKKSVMTPFE